MQLIWPENEACRAEALRSDRILDTPAEERFDDLARLAAYVCVTPIGLIGLIDSIREWFKSRIRWDVSEIPREISFGTHTITQPDALVVSDTLEDKRFAKNQLAEQVGVRFYAGVPLLTPEGYALGTLSVMDYVMLAVSNNGSGIDEQTQARIFEPFFTTKQKGKGTGLGLSTVYGIVRQSGGSITVESALREGTRFRIYLPSTAIAELEVEVEDDTPPMQPEILSGTETVLVVEDQPALLRLISVCLEKRGYTVLAAEDGAEAIRILENNPGKIDLVVSDIMMPKLNGLELREKAKLLRREMRFLFISGYTEDTIGRKFQPDSNESRRYGCAPAPLSFAPPPARLLFST